MHHARDERGFGLPHGDRIDDVVDRSRSAAGDDGNPHGFGNAARERKIVAGLRAVAIHAREQYLTRATSLGFDRPRDRVLARGCSAAIDEDFPALRVILA